MNHIFDHQKILNTDTEPKSPSVELMRKIDQGNYKSLKELVEACESAYENMAWNNKLDGFFKSIKQPIRNLVISSTI